MSLAYSCGSTAYAEESPTPQASQRISPAGATSGTINGTNLEDYYSIAFPTGCYNITLQSENKLGHILTFELDQISRGRLYSVGTKTIVGNSCIMVLAFLPSQNLPPSLLSTFSSYGLSFVGPPAGDYVIKVNYTTTTTPYSLPLKYNLTVSQVSGVTPVVSGVAQVTNLNESQTWIAKFNCTETDVYCLNVTWTDANDRVRILVTDSRGLVKATLGSSSGITGPSERIYMVMNQSMEYYISQLLRTDNLPNGPDNVTVEVTGIDAQMLSSGSTVNASFTNPIKPDRLEQFYMMDYKLGNMYNITLTPPSTADYDLFINSPFFANGSTWTSGSEIPSVNVGNGRTENITQLIAFEGVYLGLGWTLGSRYSGLGFGLYDALLIRVENFTGNGNFSLSSLPIPISVYNVTLDRNIELIYPQIAVFELATKPGYEYEITWSYNASTDTTFTGIWGPPECIIAKPLRESFDLNLLLGGVVPEYWPNTAIAGGIDGTTYNGTWRLDFYSMSSAGTMLFLLPGDGTKKNNMTLDVTEKPATSLTLNAKASGDLSLGEGALYKIHLVKGTYKFVVNRTTAETGTSRTYNSYELPMLIFDDSWNYVPLGSYYPFSSDYTMDNAYTYVNVPADADYYIWVQSSSETHYTVSVEPFIIAGLWETLWPILLGLGLGFVVGAGIVFLIKRK